MAAVNSLIRRAGDVSASSIVRLIGPRLPLDPFHFNATSFETELTDQDVHTESTDRRTDRQTDVTVALATHVPPNQVS